MVVCPRCKYRFPLAQATRDSFELFHVVRDAYCRATGYDKQYGKNELCILHGVSVEYREPWSPPSWPGIFCELWGRLFFRKSTLDYSKEEMAALIEGSQIALTEAGGELL